MKATVVSAVIFTILMTACKQRTRPAAMTFNDLPPAVQRTIREQAPNAQISNVTIMDQNGRSVYEVTFRAAGGNPRMLVGSDGAVVVSDFLTAPGVVDRPATPVGASGTPMSALPLAAQRAIQARAPASEISGITRQERNGRFWYRVTFKNDEKHPPLEVAEDGSVFQPPSP